MTIWMAASPTHSGERLHGPCPPTEAGSVPLTPHRLYLPSMATKVQAEPVAAPNEWSIEAARALYNIEGWGAGFFDINDKGHVVGERESLRNARTGETIQRVELYVMLLNSEGQLIGYEQLLKSGSIVRDSEGNPIGARYIDLRSRNPAGVLILY